MENTLAALSDELASAVQQAGRSVVAVDARPRIASSGVHWRDGVIVSASHTVKRDDDISVTMPDGRTTAAVLTGRDPGTDLAVLKVESAGLPVAEFASSAELKPGSFVLTVGRSPETGVNATLGIISAAGGPWRTWRGGLIDQFVRLDAALYPGSSGGAVVDARGQVIGIATSGLSRISGLAVPIVTVNRVVNDLLTKGRVSRGYLGVGLHPIVLPDHLKKQLKLTDDGGLIVLSVEEKGPAGQAGVLIGDILVALNGKPVGDTDDIQTILESDFVGKPVSAQLVRGGKLLDLSITVVERPWKAD